MTPLLTDTRARTSLDLAWRAVPALAGLLVVLAPPPVHAVTLLTAGRSVRFLNSPGRAPEATVRIARDPALRRLADPTCPATSSLGFLFARASLAMDDRGVVPLPCTRWSRIEDGYRYSDPTAAPGSVRQILYSRRGLVIRGGAGVQPVVGPLTFAEAILEIAGKRHLVRAYDFLRNDTGAIVSRTPSPAAAAGEAAFWEVLRGTRPYEGRALALLRRAVRRNPRDGRSWFYLGSLHAYRVGPFPRDAAAASADTFGRSQAAAALEAFDRAVDLLPHDSLPAAFRAITTYFNGLGDGDAARQALGIAQLDEAGTRNVFFNRTIGLFFLPRYFSSSSEYFRSRLLPQLDELRAVVPACPVTYPDVCRSRLVGWDREGGSILLGDVEAKGGRFAEARFWYTIADFLGRASGYPFRAVAAERLAHVAERVELYQDADPGNDPPFLGEEGRSPCRYCHYRDDR
jgi:hypothetical protein